MSLNESLWPSHKGSQGLRRGTREATEPLHSELWVWLLPPPPVCKDLPANITRKFFTVKEQSTRQTIREILGNGTEKKEQEIKKAQCDYRQRER